MDRILDAGFKQPAGENVLIQSRTHRAGEPAFKAAVARRRRARLDSSQTSNVRSPLAPAMRQIAKDGHAVLVEFDIRGDKDKAVDKIDPVLDAVAAAQRAHPGFFIGEFGDASAAEGSR